MTPITNRTAADIAAKNAKAYFNVVAGVTIGGVTSVNDWGRVYGNALYVNGEIYTGTGVQVGFTTMTAPTTSTDPRTMIMSYYNPLLANIKAMWLWVNAHNAGIAPITNWSYVAGAGNLPPSYIDINQWESTIDQIKLFMDTYIANAPKLMMEDGVSHLLLETGDKILLE